MLSAVLAAFLIAGPAPSDEPAARDAAARHGAVQDLSVIESAHGVTETLDRVEALVTANGARVFARIDHAAGAASIDASLEPTQVLIFGNPRMGTPLISESRTAAIDLPVRMLAWREGGVVYLAYTTPEALAHRHGLAPETTAPMARALANIAATAAGPDPLP